MDVVENGPNPQKVAIVLGSGGARGHAHIGVLEVLEERGLEVVAVSGCSMGALIGGVYASGHLQDYRDWAVTLRSRDVLRLVDLSLSSMGAIRGEKLFAMVTEMVGDVTIEELPVAYTAVATDLLSQREVWFQDGPLADAIRASIAIPSLLAPVITDNQLLVDGGLMNPVPILPTLAAQADLTVAVNLSGDSRRHTPTRPSGPVLSEPDDLDDELGTDAPESWRQRASRLLDWDVVRARILRDDGGRDPTEAAAIEQLGRLDIMNLSFEVMQATLTSYKLAGYPPDILIEVPKVSARTFEFARAEELIQVGRDRTIEALDRAGIR
ncbi:MAG: patatin-like phospholipase family protein [Acidimicrobiales bacterium]|nr:patatin-like phospholipase family protein [Acidimicrobiales bacterium]